MTSSHFTGSVKSKSAGSDIFLQDTTVSGTGQVWKDVVYRSLAPISGLFHLIPFHIMSKLMKFIGLYWTRKMRSPELGHKSICLNLYQPSSSNMALAISASGGGPKKKIKKETNHTGTELKCTCVIFSSILQLLPKMSSVFNCKAFLCI